MNLSLIITIVLIAIVIPWLWRCLFIQPDHSELPTLQLKNSNKKDRDVSTVERSLLKENLFGDQFEILPANNNDYTSRHHQRDLLSLSQYKLLKVISPSSRPFVGYELLQALQLVGFEYGPDQLFHYYADEESDDILFSVASSKSPGTFDLQSIGAFSTPSLTLFIDTNLTKHPETVFPIMQEIAEQLAQELEGEVQT